MSKLASLVRKLSYREGDFTLASGKKSNFYVDLKATTLHPEGIFQIAEASFRLISEKKLFIDAVGGLTLGADPIATALSLSARTAGVHWPAFIVRKEAKGHGTGKYIEGVENLRVGARVLVLEDVVTTGGSGIKAIERLREAGFNPVAVLSVVDRGEGGAEAFKAVGLPYFYLATLAEIQTSR